jgi:hypothetical protein
MQLDATYQESSEDDAEIFGAITTADTWIFVRYDGKLFYETDKCVVGSSPNLKGLDTVVDWLVSILDHMSNKC